MNQLWPWRDPFRAEEPFATVKPLYLKVRRRINDYRKRGANCS